MPLIFDDGKTPPCWAHKAVSTLSPMTARTATSNDLAIALINNMPDPALEDTELQFFELLDSAAGKIAIRIKLYSLPELPRAERGQIHLSRFYSDITELWNNRMDGVIITGTEPRRPNLRNEPYWPALVATLDWAENNTTSAVLSCLAAHASVLHSDEIPRHPLRDKRFGVFDHQKVSEHELTCGATDPMPIPQSRWNEVREEALVSSGYSILTKSIEGAADLFVKQKKNSLFVHFQGHPEYGARTLLKEFRRDIRRFLGRERETYPAMPQGYFDPSAEKMLNDFRERVLSDAREELFAEFPETSVANKLRNNWSLSATCMYRNWLQYLESRKNDAFGNSTMARISRS